MNKLALAVLGLLAALLSGANAAKDPTECEVCIASLNKVFDTVKPEEKKDLVTVETKIEKWCNAKDRNDKEKKLCYYIEPIRREVSQPYKNGVPTDKICERLKKKSAEICSLRFSSSPGAQPVDATTDFKKLRIGQLKTLIAERGLSCKDCLEKADYVRVLEESVKAGKGKSEL
jgi:mesencephalic astrocyte-derived neurotrophic factor